MRRIVIFAVAGFVAALVSAQAIEVEVDVETELKVTSGYAWRGTVLNDEPCFQPSFTVRAADLSFSAWGTWDMTDVSGSSDRARIDTTFDFSHQVAGQVFSLGLVAYLYHDDPEAGVADTVEVYLGYALDVPLLPALTVYYDFEKIEGAYASFALGHSFELAKWLALDVGVAIGAADKEYTNARFSFPADEDAGVPAYVPDKSPLIDFSAVISAPLMFGDNFAIIPGVKYMTLLDSDIIDAVEAAGGDESLVSGSLALAFYF